MKIRSPFLLVLSFVLIITQMSISIASANSEIVGEPYVDKIMYHIIASDDQQVAALQGGTIDIIGNSIDASFYSTLSAAENVEVTTNLRNGYAWMMLNCQRYPLNITSFRRAIAFAVDKEYISDTIWEGYSKPLDSVVPADNPLSIENDLETTYYDDSVSIGQQLLADAGFANIDGDSYLEAPDGSDFDITIETGSNSGISPGIGEVFEDALIALNINVTLDTDYHLDYVSRITIYRDYDIAFLGRGYSDLDIRWIVDEFHSDNSDSSLFNSPGFENDTYDEYCTQFLEATTISGMNEAATKLQEIIWYECPVIVCYQNEYLYAHRTDAFEGYENDPLDGTPCWWTNMKVHLKSGTGGTFDWSLSQDVDSFNPMVSLTENARKVNGMVWDTLLASGIDNYYVPNFAESWIIKTHDDDVGILDGHMRITFNLVQGTKCSDGSELTSADVEYSINFYRDSGSQLADGLEDLVSTSTPSPYTFTCEFSSESYWHLIAVGQKPILNKGYMEGLGLSPSQYNVWNPDPSSDTITTTGPFLFSGYTPGEFIELSRNTQYIRNEATITTTDTSTDTTSDTTNTASSTTTTTSNNTNTIPAFDPLMISVMITIASIAVIVIGLVLIKKR